MSYTLKLTDGVNSFDFTDSSGYRIMEAAFGSPQPLMTAAYDAPVTLHGNDVRQARYENRTVSLRLKLQAADVSTLKDNIRALENALEEARTTQTTAYQGKYTNLLPYSTFETGITGWSSTNCDLSWASSSPDAIEGSYCLKATCATAGNTGYAVSAPTGSGYIAPRRGKPVTFGAWCYAPSTNTTTNCLAINDGVTTTSGDTFAKDGAWHWETVTRTLASTATAIYGRTYVSWDATTNTTNYIAIDNAWLVDGSYLPPQGTPLEQRKWHLEIQWGDTETDSVYTEVVSGRLTLPDSTWSTFLTNARAIVDARLVLECKPFFLERDKGLPITAIYNAQSAATIKDSYEVSTGAYAICYGTTSQAMTFTATSSYTITGFALDVTPYGTPTGQALCTLYDTAAGLPNSILTLDSFYASTLDAYTASSDSTGALVTHHNYQAVWTSAPQALTAATKYAIVLSYPDGTSTAYLQVGYNTGAGYADGEMCQTSTAGAWVASGVGDGFFVTLAAATTTNYLDLTSTDISSGANPGAQLILRPSSITTTGKKLWIAQRSGTKADDDLWIEGEIQPGITPTWTDVATTGALYGYTTFRTLYDTTYSSGLASYLGFTTGGGSWTDEIIGYASYTINTPPRGIFRVLCKCSLSATTSGDVKVGYGYSYAGVTNTPTYAGSDFYDPDGLTDLGVIYIPSAGKTNQSLADAPLELRIYVYMNGAAVIGQKTVYITFDYIFLCPIDEGVVALSTTTTTDAPVLDTISRFPNVATMDGTSEATFNLYRISGVPDYIGKPFELSNKATRLYVLRDDVIGDYYTLYGKYRGRRLNI